MQSQLSVSNRYWIDQHDPDLKEGRIIWIILKDHDNHSNAINFCIGTKQAAASAEKLAREKELAKVLIKNEDVELIVQELEVPKTKAERTLREYQGNVVEAMASLTN